MKNELDRVTEELRKAGRGEGSLEEMQAALEAVTAAQAKWAASPEGKAAAKAEGERRAALRKIGRRGDVRAIVAAERELMADERAHRVTSQEQADFLDRGIEAMDVALKLIDKVQDPERYGDVAAAYQRLANRIKGVPNDEARQVFKEHGAELSAIEEAMAFGVPIDHDQARLLAVRQANMRAADRLYADLQRQALGMEPRQLREGQCETCGALAAAGATLFPYVIKETGRTVLVCWDCF